MRQLLFVCTGNTCRSPMAEGIFNHLAARAGLNWAADSAGLAPGEDEPISRHAATVLADSYGLEADFHRARGVNAALLAQRDLILTMTGAQADFLRRSASQEAEKIFTLAEFVCKFEVPQKANSAEGAADCASDRVPSEAAFSADIADPYGFGREDYENCARQLQGFIERLIVLLKAEEKRNESAEE